MTRLGLGLGLEIFGREMPMMNYCAFSKGKKCVKWMDYQLTRHELEEADGLCHGNWIEITRLRDRIDLLEGILNESGVEYPPEYV